MIRRSRWCACGAVASAVAMALLSSCETFQLDILTNASAAPLRVRYGLTKYRFDPGQAPTCPPGRGPEEPLTGPTPAKLRGNENWPVNTSWARPTDYTWNQDACEMEFTLQPGYSVMLTRVGQCADEHVKRAGPDEIGPYLIIESAGRRIEWHWPDVTKQFKRMGSMVCVYQVS